jgi:hypothetical protein
MRHSAAERGERQRFGPTQVRERQSNTVTERPRGGGRSPTNSDGLATVDAGARENRASIKGIPSDAISFAEVAVRTATGGRSF